MQRIVSRNDNDAAELFEVMVKDESRIDAESVHHCIAGAIGETPILVLELAEHFPSGADVSIGQVVNLCERRVEELIAKCKGAESFAACAK